MDIVKRNKSNGNQGSRENNFFPSPFNSLFDNVFSNENMIAKVPSVNVYETEHSFVLEFSAPGYKKEDFSIELENDLLSISGTYQSDNSEEQRTYTRREFGISTFKRSFSLPDSVDPEKIEASYENGLLKVTMMKREEAKPKPPKSIKVS